MQTLQQMAAKVGRGISTFFPLLAQPRLLHTALLFGMLLMMVREYWVWSVDHSFITDLSEYCVVSSICALLFCSLEVGHKKAFHFNLISFR